MENSSAAELHGFNKLVAMFGSGKKNYSRFWRARLDTAENRQTIDPRKTQLHQHDVGFQEDSFFYGVHAIGCLANHLDNRMVFKDLTNSYQDDRVSVGDQDAN